MNYNIIKNVKAQRFYDNKLEEITETVIDDIYFNIYINDKNVQNIVTIKEELEYLSYGTLFLGTDLDRETILNSKIYENNCYIYSDNTFYNLCCCMKRDKNKSRKIVNNLDREIKPEIILHIYKIFNEKSEIFKKTAGLHSASIFDMAGNLIYFAKDIARHNCIAKIAGFLLKNIEMTNETKYIFLSCRVNAEIVKMISDIGISIILTKAAVSYQGIKEAILNNMKLIGFVRENRFTYFFSNK